MEDKQIDSLNMIPFIDIMLVLLTIVLTTSSFIASGRIPVQLPQATPSESDTSPAQTIEIDAQGTIYYEGNAFSTEGLQSKLASFDSNTAFLLRADKTVQLQRFVDVADMLKQLQFKKVAVQILATKH
ncbi:MAG: ExbD/TolR family protein [Solidesulfovibrio sp.]|jgi:biopolymer transport protein ExbD